MEREKKERKTRKRDSYTKKGAKEKKSRQKYEPPIQANPKTEEKEEGETLIRDKRVRGGRRPIQKMELFRGEQCEVLAR